MKYFVIAAALTASMALVAEASAMSKFPCTPRGDLTVSPAYPCEGETHAVPVPGTLALLGVGLGFLGWRARAR